MRNHLELNTVVHSERLPGVQTAMAVSTLGLVTCCWLGLVGCESPAPPEVIVYTALDQQFSEPIFADFTAATGIRVLPKFDTESTKTVGLTQAILAERERPRCDLFWNNEILNTLRLKEGGLLRAYASPAAAPFPAEVRSPDGLWYGFAARARVLIINTNRLSEARYPDSIESLVDPQWYDQVGIAKPLFGTTATHAACLFSAWGAESAQAFFQKAKRNCRIMSGNRQVARAVGAGTLVFGLTDTDDAMLEVERGSPVKIIYPDQQDGGLGTLFIPNTLALVAGTAHGEQAEQLLDYLLSPDVEARLAAGPSAQIPLNPEVAQPARVESPQTIRAMEVDWEASAALWETVAGFLRQEFAAAQ